MSEAAFKLLEKYPIGHEFTMGEFTTDVIRLYPKARYNLSHTIDRRLREFRYGKTYDINCIDKVKSRYRKDKIDLSKRMAKNKKDKKKERINEKQNNLQ
jgi:hypothetical protein